MNKRDMTIGNNLPLLATRGVTRLYGVRGKKFGAPMFEPEVFLKQMYCVEESTCVIVGTFRRPRSDSAPPAEIRRPYRDSAPGKLWPLCPPSLRPCLQLVWTTRELAQRFVTLQQVLLKLLVHFSDILHYDDC